MLTLHPFCFMWDGRGAIAQPGAPRGSLPLPTLQQSPAALIECVDMLTAFQSFFRLGRICLCRCLANYLAKAPSPVKSRTPPGDVRGGTSSSSNIDVRIQPFTRFASAAFATATHGDQRMPKKQAIASRSIIGSKNTSNGTIRWARRYTRCI